MSQYRMRPTREIELCLQYLPAELRDIVLELRSLIVSVAPTAKEVVHRKGLLEGNEKAKRYVKLYSYDQAPWDNLKALITASAQSILIHSTSRD